jgi:hypothetical protein
MVVRSTPHPFYSQRLTDDTKTNEALIYSMTPVLQRVLQQVFIDLQRDIF